MVNSDLKKLAVKKGMKISHNICYGNLNGYTVTLRDINNGRTKGTVHFNGYQPRCKK